MAQELLANYKAKHQHPLNRLCHSIGIPMIALSILLLPLGLAAGFWALSAGLFAFGWGLQFVGHFYERKPPEFVKDWRFMLVGLHWWLAKWKGRA